MPVCAVSLFCHLCLLLQDDYHGWVMGYQYDRVNHYFNQTAVLCTTPNSPPGGGVWQAGMGFASDGTYIYLTTGNGEFNVSSEYMDS